MQPVSIMGKHLNNFERLSILEDYLSGSDSKVAIEQKYGLSHGLIRSWLSKFGLEDKVHPVPMKVSQSPQSELPLNEKEELEQLRSRPLKNLFKRETIGKWHLAYYFDKVPKSFHGSFEVISSCSQQYVYSIPGQSFVKVAA